MALPKASDFEGPVRNPPVTGPIADKIAKRKEDNNNKRFSEEELDANFAALKERVADGTKRLLEAE